MKALNIEQKEKIACMYWKNVRKTWLGPSIAAVAQDSISAGAVWMQ